MFETPYRDSQTGFEATVIYVDHTRSVCTVKPLRGGLVEGVRWLSPLGSSEREGSHSDPRLQERVFVDIQSGNPVILGSLGRVDYGESNPSHLISKGSSYDTGNSSVWLGNMRLNQSRPKDQLPGDKSMVAESGNLVAVLRGGSVLAKANDICQFLLSPFNDLARLVSRNLEIHTDLFTDVTKNLRGKAYRFIGYGDTPANAQADSYRYYEVFGDANLGEALRGGYGASKGSDGGSSGGKQIVAKRVVSDGSAKLFEETLDLDGYMTTRISDAGGSKTSQKTETNGHVKFTTSDGKDARVEMKGDSLEIQWDDKTAVFNASGISLKNQAQELKLLQTEAILTASGFSVRVGPTGIDLM